MFKIRRNKFWFTEAPAAISNMRNSSKFVEMSHQLYVLVRLWMEVFLGLIRTYLGKWILKRRNWMGIPSSINLIKIIFKFSKWSKARLKSTIATKKYSLCTSPISIKTNKFKQLFQKISQHPRVQIGTPFWLVSQLPN